MDTGTTALSFYFWVRPASCKLYVQKLIRIFFQECEFSSIISSISPGLPMRLIYFCHWKYGNNSLRLNSLYVIVGKQCKMKFITKAYLLSCEAVGLGVAFSNCRTQCSTNSSNITFILGCVRKKNQIVRQLLWQR